MRVVLDTSVLVAAARSRAGASWEVLERIRRRQIRLAASPALFLEYEEVLNRRVHRLSLDQVDGLLSELATLIVPVQIRYIWRPQLRDADDEMVLEAAINGRVKAIVTHNSRDFEQVAPRFGILVLSPAALLRTMRH